DLSGDLLNILNDADEYDVIIQAGKEPDFKEFKAHSVILRARSPYFKIALSDKWAKNKEDIYYFAKPNISPAIFHLILRYIYTGILDLQNQSGSNIFALLIAADELLLDQLVGHVQEYIQSCKEIQRYITNIRPLPINSDSDLLDFLVTADELALDELINRFIGIGTEPSWLKESLVDFLFNIVELERCGKIQDSYIIEAICIDPEPLLFELANFPTLDKGIFLELIKRDDLIIEEINVWKYLMKWGMAQFIPLPEEDIFLSEEKPINSYVTSWGKNEFTSLKKYIDQFIPYIRFYEIYGLNFIIMLYLLENIDSAIIKEENARDIARWICLSQKTFLRVKDSDRIIGDVKNNSSWGYRPNSYNGFAFYFGNGKDYTRNCQVEVRTGDEPQVDSRDRNRNSLLKLLGKGISPKLIDINDPCQVEVRTDDEPRVGFPTGDESWVDFRRGGHSFLKLFGKKGTYSILDDIDFIAEEIEIFSIKI
ncbi:5288_t:CDS:2, partial [Dentiscutata erythropus]